MQTNLGTKSVCNITKRSNGFDYTNLDHSRSHKIEKYRKNGSGPVSYKFFVPIRLKKYRKNGSGPVSYKFFVPTRVGGLPVYFSFIIYHRNKLPPVFAIAIKRIAQYDYTACRQKALPTTCFFTIYRLKLTVSLHYHPVSLPLQNRYHGVPRKFYLSPFVPENLVSLDRFSIPVPPQAAHYPYSG